MKTLLDAHGDLVYSKDIKSVMKKQNRKSTGVIWDYFNMHLQINESAEYMSQMLKKHIEFVQIKDGHFLKKNPIITHYLAKVKCLSVKYYNL